MVQDVSNGQGIHFGHSTRMQTRRKFIRDCSLAAASAALVPAAALARNPVSRTAGRAGPGFEQFSRQVNTPFFVQAGPQLVRLVLVAADTFPAASPAAEDAGNEKFSLLFRGPVQPPLGQDTYRLDHRRLGRLEIFIVPIGCLDPALCLYQAVFDRPMDAASLAAQLSRAPARVLTS